MPHFRSHILFVLLLGAGFPAWAGVASAQQKVDAFGDPLPPGAVARLGSVRLRPGMWVTRLAYSPDGKRIASWSEAGLSIWDAATGRELRRVDLPEVPAFDFRWLKDGRGLAVLQLNLRQILQKNANVFVWDFADEKAALPPTVRPAPLPRNNSRDMERYSAVAISPDGKSLAVGRQGELKKPRFVELFGLTAGERVLDQKLIHSFGQQPGDCLAIAFTPDGRSVLVFSQEHNADEELLVVYDAATGEVRRRMTIPAGNPGRLSRGFGYGVDRRGVRVPVEVEKTVAVAPDGRTVAFVAGDGTTRLWDVTLGKQTRSLGEPVKMSIWGGSVPALAFAADGRTLVVAGRDNVTRVWDLDSGKMVRAFDRDFGDLSAVAVSPDGKRVAFGGEGGLIHVRDAETGADACPVPGHRAFVSRVVASPDGRTAVTAGVDRTMRFWDPATGRERHRVALDGYAQDHQFDAFKPLFTPDGKAMLAEGKKGPRLWDAETGKPLPVPGAFAKFSGQPQAFSADGRILLTSYFSRVALWDWPTGRLRWEIDLPSLDGQPKGRAICSGASLSSDGRLVVTTSSERRTSRDDIAIDVWDAATGRRLHRHVISAPSVTEYLRPEFMPDSTSFRLADSFFRRPEGAEARANPPLIPGLTLWEAEPLKERHGFVEPWPARQRSTLSSLAVEAFSPDGRTLAVVADGRTIVLFESATGEVRRQLSGHRGDVMALAFTPDGRRLISTSRDQAALVWDVYWTGGRLPGGPAHAAPLGTGEKDNLWRALAGANAKPAYAALVRLAAAPDGVALIRERLKPAAAPDDVAFDRLLTDLDSKTFSVRQRAAAELDRLGDAAVPRVLVRWGKIESLESRRRLEQFLKKHDRGVPSNERLRELRAVELLEQIGSAEAQAVLRELAGGSPAVLLTRDAAASLRRLERRVP